MLYICVSHASALCATTSVTDVVPEAAETRDAAGSSRSSSNHAATCLAYSNRYRQLLNTEQTIHMTALWFRILGLASLSIFNISYRYGKNSIIEDG